MIKIIREPAVADKFYPADKESLKSEIDEYLKNANLKNKKIGKVRALMVPHAGYFFSGNIAASSFQHLVKRQINTVYLIGSAHTSYINTIIADASDVWETPLGLVNVDKDKVEKFSSFCNKFKIDSYPHKFDHVLEVQLPFLQTVIKNDFKIMPILLGEVNASERDCLAKFLKETMDENDIVVVSSDMSHYPSYEDAYRIDKKTLSLIKEKDIYGLIEHGMIVENEKISGEQTLLCGMIGVKLLMELAKKSNWKGEILNYLNSGDVETVNKEQVVGYGALAFTGS